TKTASNVSSSVGFTTYPTKYTVPLPFRFTVTENPVPAPPLYESRISLQNTAVDWRYATQVYKPPAGPLPVHYELYVSDRPDDPAPQLAGVTNRDPGGAAYASWADARWAKNMSLPPPGATGDPAALSAALITGAAASTLEGVFVNWRNLASYGGKPIEPNKIYYFWIRTYVIENGALNGDSEFSIMISATTPPYPQGSDDVFFRRLAPTDFSIAKDEAGDLRVTGETAVFEWSQNEAGVLYEFVISSVRDVNGFFMPDGSGLLFGDPALAPPGRDALYESFIREFTGDDGDAMDRRLLLDPDALGGGFTRDPDTGRLNLTVDRWLFPNSLYYVSLRAVSRNPDPGDQEFYKAYKNTSAFVTVPLTTLLLEAPFDLRAVVGAELAFDFAETAAADPSSTDPANANPANAVSADYHIYLRGPGKPDYAPVGGSQGTVVKTDGIVYCRIVNLEFNKSYDVRVMRGSRSPVQAYAAAGLVTRDSYHAVEVEWKGLATAPNDAFLRFQVAVLSQREMAELPSEDVAYFELADLNLMPFRYTADGRTYAYHISESAQTAADPAIMLYNAVLLTKPTRLSGGLVEQRPLEANMRYFVKVRTRKISRDDPSASAFSKYAGPVEARTDFVQGSQDEVEEQQRTEDNLRDKLAEFERETYYVADSGDRAEGKFLLKEDKVVGLIRTSPGAGYLIDVSENLKRAGADTVYIPGGVLLALQDFDKSLTLRTFGAEYTFAKNTIDLRYQAVYTDMAKKAGTQAYLVRIREGRAAFTAGLAPRGGEGITDVHRLEATVIASNRSYANIRGILDDYLYNEQTGLLNRKLAALSYNTENFDAARAGADTDTGGQGAAGASSYETEEAENRAKKAEDELRRAHDAYVEELAADIRSQASYRLGDVLEGRNGYRALAADALPVREFGAPLGVSLSHEKKQSGKVSPFVSYDGAEWFKLTQNVTTKPNAVSFSVSAPGYYSAVRADVAAGGLAEGSAEKAALEKVASRYE
ncbi:MAG: hypothetical protein LBU58_04735, partial [Clostridiales bacterium]|nr:hypothetical protein [Clostridiales bacterium]